MSRWFSRVLSTLACAAATPTPGTTMAWMSLSPLDGNRSSASCDTYVADAMTT
ncbi:MAG: hypothetical protein WD960_13505 [Gemmatimonadota bacterium]